MNRTLLLTVSANWPDSIYIYIYIYTPFPKLSFLGYPAFGFLEEWPSAKDAPNSAHPFPTRGSIMIHRFIQ